MLAVSAIFSPRDLTDLLGVLIMNSRDALTGDPVRDAGLVQTLIQNPASTVIVRVCGGTFEGIRDGDLLIVDRSLIPKAGALVLKSISGELVVSRFSQRLRLAGTEPEPVWGTVTFVIHAVS